MKKKVVRNDFFTIEVDNEKNRIYAVFSGFWQQDETMNYYIKKIKEAVLMVDSDFTLLAELSKFKTLPQDLVPKQQSIMFELAKKGMYRVAEVIPESLVAEMQLKTSAKLTNMPNEKFATIEEAEKWLDSESKLL